MIIYESLLSDAVNHFEDAIVLHRSLVSTTADAQDARRIGRLVVALFTALEKGLKGQLATIDEALTIAGLVGRS